MKFEDAHRTLAKWLNEETDSPHDLAEAIRSIKLIKGAALSALEKMENQQ